MMGDLLLNQGREDRDTAAFESPWLILSVPDSNVSPITGFTTIRVRRSQRKPHATVQLVNDKNPSAAGFLTLNEF